MVDPITRPSAPCEAQVHVLKTNPDVVVFDGHGTRRKLCSLAVYHGGMTSQRVLEPVRSVEPRKHQGLAGAGHGHVVKPPRFVRVLPGRDAFPSPVEHGDVVELEPLARWPVSSKRPCWRRRMSRPHSASHSMK